MANEHGQPRELGCQQISCRPRYHDVIPGEMESSKLTPKDTPPLVEKFDCTHGSAVAKPRCECVYCERRREVFDDDDVEARTAELRDIE